MNNKNTIIVLMYLIAVAMVPAEVWGFEKMTDLKLNTITAGGVAPANALIRIPFNYSSGKGTVDGEVIVLPMNAISQQSSLQLMDNAQSNLRSLININAVNSPVQVLLNLNININSTIGNVNQLNNLLEGHRFWR